VTQHLCYDQPLGGDSAYTVFHSTNLEKVLADVGPRGYRAALFESGLAAGRLQLAAFSLGLGATGLTFYDDEVKEVFDTDAACMLVTAVGVPDYRSRPGGRPRRPTHLVGFDDLMGRLQIRMMQSRR
jgi:nitroreductase